MAILSLAPCLLLAVLLVSLHAGAFAQSNSSSSGTLPKETPVPVPDPKPIKIGVNDSRVMIGLMECPCSPTQRGTQNEAKATLDKIRQDLAELEKLRKGNNLGAILGGGIDAKVAVLKADFEKCVSEGSYEACINADQALRGLTPICTYDSTTGRNLIKNDTFATEYVTVGPCSDNKEYALEKGPPRNEGCVAVEHLHGYVLQHPEHLRRRVLCARGFCATPNHAIIVNGVYTSMKSMCGAGGWHCVEKVKLVNNLKLAANRRAKVNEEIVVTPYDVRFPKAAIWAVQMLEDVWNMLALSVCTGTLAGVAILLLAKSETKL